MRKGKRVRFVDGETDDLADNEPNTSSRGGEAAQPRVFDAAKTSEYAFFRKIRKDAGRSYCRVLPQEDIQMKSGKSRNHKSVGTSNLSGLLRSRETGKEFSYRAEEMGATELNSFVSPPKGTSKESATVRHIDTSEKVKQSFSRLSGNLAPFDQNVFFSPVQSASIRSGNQYFAKAIFAGKRQKLHQLATDTLLPESGKSCSKGLDLVSTLLGRLYPNGKENDDPKLVEGKFHTDDHFPARNMSDVPEKKLNPYHTKKSRELINESSWNEFTPRYSSSNTKKILISEVDDPLAIDDATAIFRDEVANYNYVLDPNMFRSWCRQSDSFFCLPCEKYGHTGSFHIQELPEYHDPSEASRREPHNLLLEWDFNRHGEKPNSYRLASDIEKHIYSTSRTSRDVNSQQIADSKLDEMAFSWSSFFSPYSSKYNLFPNFHPASFRTRDIRRELEYDDSTHLEPGQFSSRLSYTPMYLTQSEECDTDNVFGSCNTILSGQDHTLCISNVFSEKHQHDFEALLLPKGLDVDLGSNYFSVTNFPGRSLSPAYHAFRFPLEKEMCPYYLSDNEQEYRLHSSNAREDYISSSQGATSYQDYSFTNTFDRSIGRPLLLHSSCWKESYHLDDDYGNNHC